MSKLSQENRKVKIPTKMAVYRACIISKLLYGCESWTTYAVLEERLNVFHLPCLCHNLYVSWQDHIINSAILALAYAATSPSPGRTTSPTASSWREQASPPCTSSARGACAGLATSEQWARVAFPMNSFKINSCRARVL